MSGAEEDYRDAEDLVHDVAADNRRRRRDRVLERDRLRRMHADEAAQDREVSKYVRDKRALRKLLLEREPRQLRRSLRRLNLVFVVVAVFGAALAALYAADVAVAHGLAGWVGYGAAAVYAAGFAGAVLWHDHGWWTRVDPPAAPAVVVWGLFALPSLVLVATAWAGWAPWAGVVTVLVLSWLFMAPVLTVVRSLPVNVRVPE
ncbi:hypothetical protein [Nocardiopsis flavescens]